MAWTDRYVRADAAGSGDGTTDTNSGSNGAWTLAEAIVNALAGHRINVKAGTYANTTNNRTFATAGTTTAPVWWRGFKTTIGDQDVKPTTTKVPGTDIPEITFTTGNCTFSGAHQLFSNIHFASARTAGAGFSNSSNRNAFLRCRFINTGNNANAQAFAASAVAGLFVACYAQASHASARVWSINATTQLVGCIAVGGGVGFYCGTSITMMTRCVARGCASHGAEFPNSATTVVDMCSFVHNGGDGIRISIAPTSLAILNSLFVNNTGTGINNSTGTNTALCFRAGNSFFGNAAEEAGFGDYPSLYQQFEAVSPIVSATDLMLVAGALARRNGVPSRFENESYTTQIDIGAVQSADAPIAVSRIIQNIGTY